MVMARNVAAVVMVVMAWGCAGGNLAHREDMIRKRQYELDRRAAWLQAAERKFKGCVTDKYPGQDPGLTPPPPVREEQPAAAPVSTGKGGVLSPEELEEVQSVERVGRSGVIECYTAELERRGDKKLLGKVVIRILIGTSGKAARVEIGQSTLKAPQVHSCIVQAIRSWDFPSLKKASWYSTTFAFSPAY